MTPKELKEAVQRMHKAVYEAILNGREDAANVQMPLEVVAELAYFYKEMGEICKDLQVECDKLSGLAQKIVCLRWMHSNAESPKIETEDFVAEPDMRMSANIPSRTSNPEAYDALLQWIGVPAEICEQELLRVHWPRFKELLTERQANGLPLPPGISPEKTHAHYHLKFKPKGASER